MSDSSLNPSIQEIEYGKKTLKTLTLYPLSISDQFKVTELITGIIQDLVQKQQEGVLGDFAFMSAVIENVEKNLAEVLILITDLPKEEIEEVMQVMTNPQLMDVVEILWEVNFEPSLKKGKDLFDRGKNLFNSKRSSQISSSATPSTDSKMFTDESTLPEE